MRRREALHWMLLGAASVSAGGCAGIGTAPSAYTLPLERLQGSLGPRFPIRRSASGLADLELHTPVLRLLPQQNRIGLALGVLASGPVLGRHTGDADLTFALRYEPSDQTIRAHQLQVTSLRLPGLPSRATELLNAQLPQLSRLLGDVVLHQLKPEQIAVARSAGVQPGEITVVGDGVRVAFVPAAR